MIFQFEHLGLWNSGDSHFDVNSYKSVLIDGKNNLKIKVGMRCLLKITTNHDVYRRGDDDKYWYESATSHAAVYFLQQGTPFIYQGQEIGMTNYPFESIETFNDVAVKMTIK